MIPLTRPHLDFEDVAEDLRRIVGSGVLTGGEYVEGFEADVADRVGATHAIATTSATTALHLALAAAGVEPGDEVLVSDFTFLASGNAIAQCGAVPVLVDCLPGSFLLDVADAAARVTKRTRAVMVVDPFGQPAHLAAANVLADQNALVLIEDAACALGASRDARRSGSWPAAGCFSSIPARSSPPVREAWPRRVTMPSRSACGCYEATAVHERRWGCALSPTSLTRPLWPGMGLDINERVVSELRVAVEAAQ